MTFSPDQNKPGGDTIDPKDVIPAEFSKYFQKIIHSGEYKEMKARGKTLEDVFEIWKKERGK